MTEKNGFRVWDEELDKEFFTDEEIAESDMRVELASCYQISVNMKSKFIEI